MMHETFTADERDELSVTLQTAIDRSISHNEIVPVPNFPADRKSTLSLLNDLLDEDVEWVLDDGVLDCWGCDEVHEDIMLWRLLVDCCESE